MAASRPTMNSSATTEPEESQNAPDEGLQKLMADMVDAQRKRRQIRKHGVNKAYAKAHTNAQEAIASLFDEHETEAAKAYNAQLSRLQSLLKRKADIEAAMTEKLAVLRADYLANSQALQKVVEYHAKGLR